MQQYELSIGRSYEMKGNNGKVTIGYHMPEIVEYHTMTLLKNHGIDGFSAHWQTGYWQGTKEDSYHVTVVTDIGIDEMKRIAEELRDTFFQQSVLLVAHSVKAWFV